MKEEKYIYAGYDISSSYTQISCLRAGEDTPEAVGTSETEAGIMIPTALCHIEATGEWLFGEDAVWGRKKNAGNYIEDFTKLIYDADNAVYGKNKLPVQVLLDKFIVRTLNLIKQKYPDRQLAGVAVTMPKLNDRLKCAIKASFAKAGINEDRLSIVTYTDCFIHYMLSLEDDSLKDRAVVFDCMKDEIQCTLFTSGGLKNTLGQAGAVSAKNKEISDEWNELLKIEQKEKKTEQLLEIVSSVTGVGNYNTIFFTGDGFDEEWAQQALKNLCAGNRVFKGRNLYTRGAVFYARNIREKLLKDMTIFDDNMIDSSIALRCEGEKKECLLVAEGTDYRDIQAEKRVILKNSDSIDFIVKNQISGTKRMFSFIPENLPERRKEMLQFMVSIRMTDVNTVVIKVKDLGFTNMFKNTYRVWEKHFNI